MLCDARGARATTGRRIKTDREDALNVALLLADGRLGSVPEVGLVTAATVIVEIGDFSRFADSKVIGRYAGLAPTVYAPGNFSRLGQISKTGTPDLRWVLQQAAWTATCCDAGFKKTRLRIAKTAGTKAAAVAIARKILVLMWTLQRKEEPYKSRDPVAA